VTVLSSRYRVGAAIEDELPACVLHDDEADLHATWVPSAGMLGASLVHRGEELLWRGAGVGGYARERKFMGIPFLHPWANRLDEFGYSAGGHDVALDKSSPLLLLDDHGLPIHGLLNADSHWSAPELAADEHGARLLARLEFDRPDLLEAFPFAHLVEIEVRVADGELRVRTTLTATGDGPVPVSFGFHPYLRLRDVARADWRVSFPVRRRWVLDARRIPTGVKEPVEGLEGRIGDHTWDDEFDQIEPPGHFSLRGGDRSISVHYLDGYPIAQIFAPPGEEYVCIEPMTAPSNALRGPDSAMRWVAPGESWSATFAIVCGVD
jgi:galactose mutarotase-like enzyme